MTVREQVVSICDSRIDELTKGDCDFIIGFLISISKYIDNNGSSTKVHTESHNPPITMTKHGT